MNALVPAQHEADRHRQSYAAGNAEKHATAGHQDVHRQPTLGKFNESAEDVVRRRHERRIDEPAVMDGVPSGEQKQPRQEDESGSAYRTMKACQTAGVNVLKVRYIGCLGQAAWQWPTIAFSD